MKLTSNQIRHVQNQVELEPLPENHPNMPELKDAFGDHTFYLRAEGLQILEPAQNPDVGEGSARMVTLASWVSSDDPTMAVHEPTPTELFVNIAPDGRDPAA